MGQADTGHYTRGVFLGLPDHPDTGRLAGGEVWRQEGVWVLHVDDCCGHFTDTCWRQTQSIRPARSQSGQGTGRGRFDPYKALTTLKYLCINRAVFLNLKSS